MSMDAGTRAESDSSRDAAARYSLRRRWLCEVCCVSLNPQPCALSLVASAWNSSIPRHVIHVQPDHLLKNPRGRGKAQDTPGVDFISRL